MNGICSKCRLKECICHPDLEPAYLASEEQVRQLQISVAYLCDALKYLINEDKAEAQEKLSYVVDMIDEFIMLSKRG